MTDPQTGIKVIQLTSYPSPSAHFPYDWPCVTPDNQRLVLYCQRWAQRGAPWDIFRVDADGLNLFQLTERGEHDEPGGYYGRPWAVLTLDGKTLYVNWGKSLGAVEVETGEEEQVCSLEKFCPEGSTLGRMALSASGKRLFITRGGPVQSAVRVDLETGKAEEVDFGGHVFGCDQARGRVIVQRGELKWGTTTAENGGRRIANVGSQLSLWSFDEDGGDPRLICPQMFAHATLLGKTPRIQGCGLPPHRCIWIAEEGKEPEKLVQGPYFWHSGASFDGEWIAADTNWPDRGIQLIHVPTRHFRTLCHPHATLEHVEYGHPHPTVSQDGRLVIFRSDRTGVSQVYVAHVTEEFRESVKASVLDNPKDKWT